MKNFTRSVLCAVTAAYLTMAGSVIAGGDKDVRVIKVLRDDDTITVHHGDDVSVEIPEDALGDSETLRGYLAELDNDTQELVLNLLSGMDSDEEHHQILKLSKFIDKHHAVNRKVIVMGDDHLNLGGIDLEDHQVQIHTDADVSPEVLVKKFKEGHGIMKHVVVNIDDDEAHQKAILSLLEKGEYSQEQLDEIQQVLDSKR